MVKVWVLLGAICASDGDKGVRCTYQWFATFRTQAECLDAGRLGAVTGPGRRWQCVQRSSPT